MGLWQLSRAAWRDAFEAMRRNPSLFTVAVIAMLVIGAGYNNLVIVPQMAALRSGDLTAASSVGFAPLTLLMTALQVVVMAPCAVAVHRLILAHEPVVQLTRGAVRRWGNFALWLFIFDLLILGPGMLAQSWGRGHHFGPANFLRGVLVFFALSLSLIVSVRLTLMFPAAGIDVATPYRRSWELTRGHWWAIAGTLAFNTLGIGLLAIVPVGLATLAARGSAGTVLAMMNALVHILSTAVVAAVASWLYRRHGGVADVSPWGGTAEVGAVSVPR